MSSEKFREVQTSCDTLRQVPTSSDMSRLVQTSCDQSGRALLQGPSTVRAILAGPWSFRKQHQTTIIHSHKVPGPSGHSRRVLEPSENNVRPSDHRKRQQNDRNHENRWKWTHMARNDLRIRPFEAHSHFPSIANPPRLQTPQENPKNPHLPKNQ